MMKMKRNESEEKSKGKIFEIEGRGRRDFMMKSSLLPIGALTLSLSACEGTRIRQRNNTNYEIDKSISSANQDSRIRTVVLHYTALPLMEALSSLTNSKTSNSVSAHYLVPDVANDGSRFRIYQLVPEVRRAWHAGVSYWQGDRMLNASSIGIEIVNLGFPLEDEAAPFNARRWYAYPDAQITAIGQLVSNIVTRHQIRPYKVVGHADVAPGRKYDPGPLFPWKKLYEQFQVGAWPDAEVVNYYRYRQPFDGNNASLQERLLAYGYEVPQTGMLDTPTRNAVMAFQMHFRPARYDGEPDIETVAILDALLEKYFNRAHSQSRQRMQSPRNSEKGSDTWPIPEENEI